MRGGIKVVWVLLFVIGIIAVLVPRVVGSGYHPGIDQAISEAKIIVVGQVTKAWKPKARLNVKNSSHISGEVYSMRVTDVYKGNVKVGDDIVFWDPSAWTSAGYFVINGRINLTFLVDGSPDADDLELYDYGAEIKYAPIGNFMTPNAYRPEEYDTWVYLLNMILRNSPPKNIDSYRTILSMEKNTGVLSYILDDWPKEMSNDDEVLFRGLLKKYKDDPSITSPILERLKKAGKGFTTAEIVEMLKSCAEFEREEMLGYVNSGNIAACREIIFGWILTEWAWDESTAELAKLAPDYLKEQLRKRDLPFWVLVPCLQELHINGRAVGKRDFPASVFKSNPYVLREFGKVINGNDLSALSAMEDPEGNSDWRVGFPLLDPLLAGKDCFGRRLMVATMRTFGENVKRTGRGYTRVPGGAKLKSPVRIELAANGPMKIGKPILIKVREIGLVNEVWISYKGELGYSIAGPKYGTRAGVGFGIWKDTRAPRRDFTKLRKGSVHVSTDDISSYIDRPGEYRIEIKKFYPHEGVSAGIDAWTGVVFSKPLRIRVVK